VALTKTIYSAECLNGAIVLSVIMASVVMIVVVAPKILFHQKYEEKSFFSS
jgi:hypothetical protein